MGVVVIEHFVSKLRDLYGLQVRVMLTNMWVVILFHAFPWPHIHPNLFDLKLFLSTLSLMFYPTEEGRLYS